MPEKIYASDIWVDKQSLSRDLEWSENAILALDTTQILDQTKTLVADYENKAISVVKEKFWLDITKVDGMQWIDGKYKDLGSKMSAFDKAVWDIDKEIGVMMSRDEIIKIASEKLEEAWKDVIKKINIYLEIVEKEKARMLRKKEYEALTTVTVDQQKTRQQEQTKALKEQKLHQTYNLSLLNEKLDTPLTTRQEALFLSQLDTRLAVLKQSFSENKYTKPATWQAILTKNYTDRDRLFDVEYIDADGEEETTLLFDKKSLWPELYAMIDGNEDIFKDWLSPHIDGIYYTQAQKNKENKTEDILDIARSEPRMKETMKSRASTEVERIIQTLTENNSMPWWDKPFQDSSIGDHVLEFDVWGTLIDKNIFDFDSDWRKQQNKNDDQKDVLKKLLNAGWNNDKLVYFMNTVFAKKRAEHNLNTAENKQERQKTLATLNELDTTSVCRIIENDISQYKQLFADQSGTFWSIDEEDRLSLRQKEQLIQESLAQLSERIKNLPAWTAEEVREKQRQEKQYHAVMALFVDIQNWIGTEDADLGEAALTSWAATRRVDDAIQHIDSKLFGKTTEQQVDIYRDTMVAIALNTQQSDSFKETKRYTDALWKKIGENIKKIWQTEQQKTTPHTDNIKQYKTQLFRLIQFMRDEWSWKKEVNESATQQFYWYSMDKAAERTRRKEEARKWWWMDSKGQQEQTFNNWVHNDFKNTDQAQEFMNWMMTSWWVAERVKKKFLPEWWWREQWENADSSQREDFLLEKIWRPTNDTTEVKQNVLTQLLWEKYDQITTKPYAELSMHTRVTLDALHVMSQRRVSFSSILAENKGDTTKAVAAYMTIMTDTLRQSQADLMGTFAQTLHNSTPTWLTWVDKEIFTAFNDMKGVWFFNLTDKNYTKALEYADMWGSFVVALIATLAAAKTLWGTSWAAVSAWSAFANSVMGQITIASLAGSAAGIGYEVARWHGYENAWDAFADISSTMATDRWVTVLTLWLGKWAGAVWAKTGLKFSRWTAALLKPWTQTKNIINAYNKLASKGIWKQFITETGREIIIETPLWLIAEKYRQKIINWKDITLEEMMESMWPLLGIMVAMKLNDIPGMKEQLRQEIQAKKAEYLPLVKTQIENLRTELKKNKQAGMVGWVDDTGRPLDIIQAEIDMLEGIKKEIEPYFKDKVSKLNFSATEATNNAWLRGDATVNNYKDKQEVIIASIVSHLEGKGMTNIKDMIEWFDAAQKEKFFEIINNAHFNKEGWVLWDLTPEQLKEKSKILNDELEDLFGERKDRWALSRFLIEGGWCGESEKIDLNEVGSDRNTIISQWREQSLKYRDIKKLVEAEAGKDIKLLTSKYEEMKKWVISKEQFEEYGTIFMEKVDKSLKESLKDINSVDQLGLLWTIFKDHQEMKRLFWTKINYEDNSLHQFFLKRRYYDLLTFTNQFCDWYWRNDTSPNTIIKLDDNSLLWLFFKEPYNKDPIITEKVLSIVNQMRNYWESGREIQPELWDQGTSAKNNINDWKEEVKQNSWDKDIKQNIRLMKMLEKEKQYEVDLKEIQSVFEKYRFPESNKEQDLFGGKTFWIDAFLDKYWFTGLTAGFIQWFKNRGHLFYPTLHDLSIIINAKKGKFTWNYWSDNIMIAKKNHENTTTLEREIIKKLEKYNLPVETIIQITEIISNHEKILWSKNKDTMK